MTNHSLFPVPDSYFGKSWIDAAKYEAMYEQSIKDPDGFWGSTENDSHG